MAAHKGPDKGSQPRTLRGRALEIGTDPRNFGGAVGYYPQGGHPISDQHPEQHYEERAMEKPSAGKKPIQENPIKVGK